MARIKKTFIDKVIKESKITFNKNKNFYVYSYVDVNDGVGIFNVNNNFEKNVTKKLLEYINKSNYKNVVLICRSEKEQFAEAFPTSVELEYLQNNIEKELTIFYQEPWPSHVPNFVDDKTTLYIRFGFDEGCEFDKLCVNNPTFKTTQDSGDYFFLLNNVNSKLIY